MMVFDVKGRMEEIGPGVSGAEAEATVSGTDGKEMFVYAWCFEGCYGYSVTDKSRYGMSGKEECNKECAESYEELAEAKKSAYYKVFSVLDKMLRLIEGN